jgi:hypothetical protein
LLNEKNYEMKNALYNVGSPINKSYEPKGEGFLNLSLQKANDFKINLISCIDGNFT